jgi:hypothetical protein
MSRLMIDIRSLTWTQTFLSSSTACAVSIGAARRQQELMRPDLDLLYYVGHIQNDQSLIDIATQHADSIIHEILRPDFSSYHLVNFDPRSGRPQAKMTNQGRKVPAHSDEVRRLLLEENGGRRRQMASSYDTRLGL